MTQRFVFASAFVLLAACGNSTPPPATPGTPETTGTNTTGGTPAAVEASGTFRGNTFKFACTKLSSDLGNDSAAYSDESHISISCADPSGSGLRVYTSVKKLAVGESVPSGKSEDTGRINMVSETKDGIEILSTLQGCCGGPVVDAPRGETGTISVTAYDAKANHVAGVSKLTWAKDSSGKPGSVEIKFDLIAPAR